MAGVLSGVYTDAERRGADHRVRARVEPTFMDSGALHAILTARARLAAADCRLVRRGKHTVLVDRGAQQTMKLFDEANRVQNG